MSDHANAEIPAASDSSEKPASGGSIVPWIAVGVLSAGMGSALPFLVTGQQTHAAGASGDTDEHGVLSGSGEHGGSRSGTPGIRGFTMPKQEDTIFLPFGEPGGDQSVVINLDEGRMTRFLRIAISLQIPKSQEESFKKLIDAKKIVLRNWLLSHISDLDLEDIRGAAGQNRLRREIRDQFNAVLCPDGYDQVYDVLFEEFNVQ